MTRPALRPVPQATPRALGLVRVSKEREGMVSPEIQRTAITDYAAARGYQITGWVEGLDESGSRARSAWWPTLERSVAEVEAGTYDVIVVWKFSRVARHRLRWAAAIDRVETAGGRIESSTEQFDTTTSSGRLARGMVGELNAFMAEQIGEGWKEAHARRVAAGKPGNGLARWGYVYDRAQKLHVPDPVTGPVLAALYRRYAASETFFDLARWLNAHGYRTSRGGLWSVQKLSRMMDNPFATGRFLANGVVHQGVHEPLIDEATWLAYVDARARRRPAPPRRERSVYLLSGLIRCSRCEGTMTAGISNHRTGPQYRCKTNRSYGPEACPGGYVTSTLIEAEIRTWLRTLAGEVDAARAAQAAAAAHRVVIATDATRLARQAQRTEEALTRLALQNAETPLPAASYRAAYDELTGQLATITAALEAAGREERRAVANPGQVARDLLAGWELRPVAQRREVLQTLISHVRVTTGRPRVRDIRIVPAWEED